MQPITDDKFQELLDSDLPSIVQFSAEWCGPCKQLTPIMRQVELQYEGKVNFFKMDVDSNPASSVQYGVRGIPTLIIFKDGKAVDTTVGNMSESELVSFIDGSV